MKKYFNFIKIISLSLVLVIFLFITASCANSSSSNFGMQSQDKFELNLKAAEPVGLTLVDYSTSNFTMKIPQDWVIETTGEYENFGFRLYDPNNSARQIFFYGNMSPFMKSEEGKNAWETYINQGGYASAKMYADAPVLSPATTEGLFYNFNKFTSFANNYGINHKFPMLTDLEIVESTKRDSSFSAYALDDSVVRGLFTQDGIPCEGLFAASVFDAMKSYMYGVDAGYYTAYVIVGISAPSDEFCFIQNVLAESLASFKFSDKYIQQGVNQNAWETQQALKVGQTLSAAYDSYNQAWSNRQVTYDVLSQKRSDATLGYDRLYDTTTGDVYRAELGFYDKYDINREEYGNPNLQIVPDDDYNLYGKGISGYIYNPSK